ncbi:MAG: linear amide C-N hydrolase [Ignavibacteriales bacterium]|nr:linear amide C-N hydrolase [Ignavibacteriales bacterium]MCF8317017.1 linear amide C-N hydrolase [Ignavibacteriales bacterium]MCF8438615.1 linear amide C-N hydrolase [Ignavibacteriales bacterium]
MKKIFLVIFLSTTLVLSQGFENCSVVSLISGDTVVWGRNHDEKLSNCLIVYNPAGLYKQGFELENEKNPVWISKYASLTCNILGAGFAILGMNEKGMTIGHVGFKEAEYPQKDERPVLDQIQFVSYILDNCASTWEVIKELDSVRISNESITLEHYFVCDKSGEKAIIGFIEGNLVLYTGEKFVHPLMSNDSYKKSLEQLKKYIGFGGDTPIPDRTFGVEEIMAIGANDIQSFISLNNKDIINSAFSILHNIGFNKFPPPEGVVVHPNYGTQFTTVFDLKNLQLYFRTKSNGSIRNVDFNLFNSMCNYGMWMLEIEKTDSGNVNELFVKYSSKKNCTYLTEWNNQSFLLSQELIDFLCNYPETYLCK